MIMIQVAEKWTAKEVAVWIERKNMGKGDSIIISARGGTYVTFWSYW